MFDRPRARADVIAESIDDGTVIYVEETHQAHYLDEAATSVWVACDGSRTAEDIAWNLDADQNAVDATLRQLADSALLAPPHQRLEEPSEGISRRALLRRGAVAGAAITVGAGTILTVDVPSALAAISHALTLNLYRTPSLTCNTTLTSDLRGSVVVSITAVAGNPALDKLTLVVTLTAYTSGLGPEVFDIAINCSASIGTITTGANGAGGPTTVTTTVPTGQISAVSVTPRTQQLPTLIYTKASPTFTG